MNKNILKKCLDELQKENPRLDYVRGILETLIESLEVSATSSSTFTYNPPIIYNPPITTSVDEATMLENEAKAKLKSVENIINKSVTME